MTILLHGTTRHRAEQILAVGPDPDFRESSGGARAESFSTYLERGPFLFGPIEAYARGKAKEFKSEGGPAILAVDVPDDIVKLAGSWISRSAKGLFNSTRGLAWRNCEPPGRSFGRKYGRFECLSAYEHRVTVHCNAPVRL